MRKNANCALQFEHERDTITEEREQQERYNFINIIFTKHI